MQTYGAEAGPESAIQPMEETGMSEEVLQKVRFWNRSVQWCNENVCHKRCLKLLYHFSYKTKPHFLQPKGKR